MQGVINKFAGWSFAFLSSLALAPALFGFAYLELETLPSSISSYPLGVTADGLYIAGFSKNSGGGKEAVRWDRFGVLHSFGLGIAWDISDDGETLVGVDGSDNSAFWRVSQVGAQIFQNTEVGAVYTVTSDGTVGYGAVVNGASLEATRFDLVSGISSRVLLPYSLINQVTGDGLISVGGAENENGSGAFRKANQVTEFLNGGVPSSESYGVSDNGRIVVGRNGFSAVRWVDDKEPEELGFTFNGSFAGREVCISGDGKVIVGGDVDGDGFVWTEKSGYQSLKNLISSGGFDLSEYSVFRASGISKDGNVVVGFALNPSIGEIPWMVRGFLQILEPTISIEKVQGGLEVVFTGILQDSTDLTGFLDVPGEPVSPYFIPEPVSGKRFFRARSF